MLKKNEDEKMPTFAFPTLKKESALISLILVYALYSVRGNWCLGVLVPFMVYTQLRRAALKRINKGQPSLAF